MPAARFVGSEDSICQLDAEPTGIALQGTP
jgi:hypothetical protein